MIARGSFRRKRTLEDSELDSTTTSTTSTSDDGWEGIFLKVDDEDEELGNKFITHQEDMEDLWWQLNGVHIHNPSPDSDNEDLFSPESDTKYRK